MELLLAFWLYTWWTCSKILRILVEHSINSVGSGDVVVWRG